ALFVSALAVLALSCAGTPRKPQVSGESDHKPSAVLLISLDGVGWDYLDRFEPPNLIALAENGVRAEGLKPVFPTKTFPNHFTIVTGLYPEDHGIVSNNMYDPDRRAYFRPSDSSAVTDPVWWQGEPIWVTAENQGRVAATYFWPGSEAPIEGVLPSYYVPFDQDVPPVERANQVLRWLDLPIDRRPAFISLYFGHTDRAGHRYGVDDPRTAESVREIDGVLGQLFAGLRTRGLFEHINIIVVSDHGMTDLSPDRVIFLDDYLGPDDAEVIDWSPVLALRPKSLSLDSLFRRLSDAHPNLAVYRREELPSRLHYSDHPRIAPLIGIADEGWSIGRRSRFDERYYQGANHGYDNALESMQGILVAHGPAFERGKRIPSVENIHLYELMADILGVEPAPNDGSLAASASMRREGTSRGKISGMR
ncbi:MAG: ectonucleotide pyrophosphatase/phosphodiesterase, partial [Rhodothermales bacterium]|nr:ectonucleotide pyrophosphatase/phosphodiesterase [Rhodothermales bacterium]